MSALWYMVVIPSRIWGIQCGHILFSFLRKWLKLRTKNKSNYASGDIFIYMICLEQNKFVYLHEKMHFNYSIFRLIQSNSCGMTLVINTYNSKGAFITIITVIYWTQLLCIPWLWYCQFHFLQIQIQQLQALFWE
jgi:hypothetical protein